VTISLEGGTRVGCTADLKMEGTGKRPSVKGKIAIESGVIMVSERRRDLHPVEGKSVLWETIASSQAPEGSIRREEATGRAPAAALRGGVSGDEDASRPGNIDLDVDVVIPSGLWIRGNNLAVELTGELSLVQKEALPTISGSLQTLQGRFVLLDRAFTLDRGTVTFYGGDEIDPSLDLMMTTDVDGNSIYLSITGTALDPELKLSSDPEMTDSDIMALLLFGRTGDELDSGQTDLLGKRVASIAASMGGAKLEAKLAQELGVDMIGIRRSTGDEGGSSLVIAKYLSPRVMLKYEQALEESGRFLVNLEYLLAKSFKLETLIGHQDQSAVGLGWSKDY
jgi:translocation and assembly module TamB